jgi:hypothetical protein
VGDGVFHGDAAAHGRPDQHGPVDVQLVQQAVHHLALRQGMGRAAAEAGQVHGEHAQALAGELAKGAEFAPGLGLELHAMQENHGPAGGIAGLQAMDGAVVKVDLSGGDTGHKTFLQKKTAGKHYAGGKAGTALSDIRPFVNGAQTEPLSPGNTRPPAPRPLGPAGSCAKSKRNRQPGHSPFSLDRVPVFLLKEILPSFSPDHRQSPQPADPLSAREFPHHHGPEQDRPPAAGLPA